MVIWFTQIIGKFPGFSLENAVALSVKRSQKCIKTRSDSNNAVMSANPLNQAVKSNWIKMFYVSRKIQTLMEMIFFL